MTIAELVVALAAAVLLIGVLMACHHMLERQTKVASDGLDQAQAAVRLMETFRLELSGLVMNPVDHAEDHLGNSLLVSAHGNAIQFVTEHRERGTVRRKLISYEARRGTGPALTLTRRSWEFTRADDWKSSVATTGWPAEWIGRELPRREAEYRRLSIQDLSFQYLVPEDDASQVYIRVKAVLKSPGGRMMPLTTLVALPTPRSVSAASSCPCVNAPCYDPAKADCACCLTEPEEPVEAAEQPAGAETAPEDPAPEESRADRLDSTEVEPE